MKKNKSMIDSALEIVTKEGHALKFGVIFEKVKKDLEMTDAEADARIGEFYTGLTLDGRFVALTNNEWDLRSRHTFEKVTIDLNDVYNDANTVDDDPTEQQEQAEEESEISGTILDDEDSPRDEEEEDGERKDESYFR